jgi:hypothetical protein
MSSIENEVGIRLWIAFCPWMLDITWHPVFLSDLMGAARIDRQVSKQAGRCSRKGREVVGEGLSLSFTICY